ncbi:hypothetical protein CYMTET_16825, partial [Cymbomonas tetramitiformis]
MIWRVPDADLGFGDHCAPWRKPRGIPIPGQDIETVDPKDVLRVPLLCPPVASPRSGDDLLTQLDLKPAVGAKEVSLETVASFAKAISKHLGVDPDLRMYPNRLQKVKETVEEGYVYTTTTSVCHFVQQDLYLVAPFYNASLVRPEAYKKLLSSESSQEFGAPGTRPSTGRSIEEVGASQSSIGSWDGGVQPISWPSTTYPEVQEDFSQELLAVHSEEQLQTILEQEPWSQAVARARIADFLQAKMMTQKLLLRKEGIHGIWELVTNRAHHATFPAQPLQVVVTLLADEEVELCSVGAVVVWASSCSTAPRSWLCECGAIAALMKLLGRSLYAEIIAKRSKSVWKNNLSGISGMLSLKKAPKSAESEEAAPAGSEAKEEAAAEPPKRKATLFKQKTGMTSAERETLQERVMGALAMMVVDRACRAQLMKADRHLDQLYRLTTQLEGYSDDWEADRRSLAAQTLANIFIRDASIRAAVLPNKGMKRVLGLLLEEGPGATLVNFYGSAILQVSTSEEELAALGGDNVRQEMFDTSLLALQNILQRLAGTEQLKPTTKHLLLDICEKLAQSLWGIASYATRQPTFLLSNESVQEVCAVTTSWWALQYSPRVQGLHLSRLLYTFGACLSAFSTTPASARALILGTLPFLPIDLMLEKQHDAQSACSALMELAIPTFSAGHPTAVAINALAFLCSHLDEATSAGGMFGLYRVCLLKMGVLPSVLVAMSADYTDASSALHLSRCGAVAVMYLCCQAKGDTSPWMVVTLMNLMVISDDEEVVSHLMVALWVLLTVRSVRELVREPIREEDQQFCSTVVENIRQCPTAAAVRELYNQQQGCEERRRQEESAGACQNTLWSRVEESLRRKPIIPGCSSAASALKAGSAPSGDLVAWEEAGEDGGDEGQWWGLHRVFKVFHRWKDHIEAAREVGSCIKMVEFMVTVIWSYLVADDKPIPKRRAEVAELDRSANMDQQFWWIVHVDPGGVDMSTMPAVLQALDLLMWVLRLPHKEHRVAKQLAIGAMWNMAVRRRSLESYVVGRGAIPELVAILHGKRGPKGERGVPEDGGAWPPALRDAAGMWLGEMLSEWSAMSHPSAGTVQDLQLAVMELAKSDNARVQACGLRVLGRMTCVPPLECPAPSRHLDRTKMTLVGALVIETLARVIRHNLDVTRRKHKPALDIAEDQGLLGPIEEEEPRQKGKEGEVEPEGRRAPEAELGMEIDEPGDEEAGPEALLTHALRLVRNLSTLADIQVALAKVLLPTLMRAANMFTAVLQAASLEWEAAPERPGFQEEQYVQQGIVNLCSGSMRNLATHPHNRTRFYKLELQHSYVIEQHAATNPTPYIPPQAPLTSQPPSVPSPSKDSKSGWAKRRHAAFAVEAINTMIPRQLFDKRDTASPEAAPRNPPSTSSPEPKFQLTTTSAPIPVPALARPGTAETPIAPSPSSDSVAAAELKLNEKLDELSRQSSQASLKPKLKPGEEEDMDPEGIFVLTSTALEEMWNEELDAQLDTPRSTTSSCLSFEGLPVGEKGGSPVIVHSPPVGVREGNSATKQKLAFVEWQKNAFSDPESQRAVNKVYKKVPAAHKRLETLARRKDPGVNATLARKSVQNKVFSAQGSSSWMEPGSRVWAAEDRASLPLLNGTLRKPLTYLWEATDEELSSSMGASRWSPAVKEYCEQPATDLLVPGDDNTGVACKLLVADYPCSAKQELREAAELLHENEMLDLPAYMLRQRPESGRNGRQPRTVLSTKPQDAGQMGLGVQVGQYNARNKMSFKIKSPPPADRDEALKIRVPKPKLVLFEHIPGAKVSEGMFPDYLLPNGKKAFFYFHTCLTDEVEVPLRPPPPLPDTLLTALQSSVPMSSKLQESGKMPGNAPDMESCRPVPPKAPLPGCHTLPVQYPDVLDCPEVFGLLKERPITFRVWSRAVAQTEVKTLKNKVVVAPPKEKGPFDPMMSVFKPRCKESEARAFFLTAKLRKKLVDVDFSRMERKEKFKSMLFREYKNAGRSRDASEEAMLKETYEVISKYHLVLMQTFDHYSSLGGNPFHMGLNSYTSLMDDCK